MTKNCATCRFMAAPRETENADLHVTTDHQTCTRVIHGNRRYDPKVRNEPAMVVDGSGYAARLIGLPTFGCTLHEERHEDR